MLSVKSESGPNQAQMLGGEDQSAAEQMPIELFVNNKFGMRFAQELSNCCLTQGSKLLLILATALFAFEFAETKKDKTKNIIHVKKKSSSKNFILQFHRQFY